MAYVYSSGRGAHILALDLTSNNITAMYITHLDLMSIATDGTILYLLNTNEIASSIYTLPLSLDGGRLTLMDSIRMPPYERMFAVDNKLVLIGQNRIGEISLPNFVFTAFPTLALINEGAVQVGSDIYVLGPSQTTVISQQHGLRQYSMGSAYFKQVWAAAELNGRIYFSAHDSVDPVLTINTNALFKPYDMVASRADVAFNGFYFVIPVPIGRGISYIKLATGQAFSYNCDSLLDFAETAFVTIDNTRLVIIRPRERFYDMFDTVTETWISEEIPSSIPVTFTSSRPTSLYDLAVFKAAAHCFIFNTTARTWTSLTVKGSVQAVGSSLAFITLNEVQFYDVLHQQWSFKISRPSQVHFTTDSVASYRGLLFFAGGRLLSGQFFDDVTIIDSRDGSVTNARLSAPRMNIEILGIGDYVIFAGGTERMASSAIDVFNVLTSQWRTFSLIRTALGRVAMTPFRDSVFFTLPNAVELLNLTSLSMQQMPVPFTSPPLLLRSLSGGSFGSKVVLFGKTPTELSVTLYEASTGISSTIAFNPRSELFGQVKRMALQTTQNFLIAVVRDVPHVFQFATMTNTLQNGQLFYHESIVFDANAKGDGLTSQWYHNDVQIIGETDTRLMLRNVTQEEQGSYSAKIIDQCNQSMIQRASLVVNGPPVITDELTESLVMCHEKTEISTTVSGEQVTLNWTIGSLSETTMKNESIVVNGSSFLCNTVHDLCVTAINPSGSVTQCTTVRLAAHDSVFSGPHPISSQPLLLRKTDVSLVVSLLDQDCDEHAWLVNGVETDVRSRRTSTMTVHLDQNMIVSRFSVRAQCGNSNLTSHEFKFDNVSSLDTGGVVAVVLVCFIAMIGAVLIAFFVRRRMVLNRKNEVELESLLNQAKAETLNRDGVPILQSTTWEWSPTEQFAFKPIDKMLFSLDTSSLASLTKHEPIKVGVWNQSIISFSLHRGSNNKRNNLKERLINGTHVDIYAPKSPKYEIKIEPSSFDLDSDSLIHVTVSSMMRITAKCKVGLIVVCEHEQVYSIYEFKLTSAMSTWIDLDEIEMTGDYLGGGGFGSVTRGIYRGQEVAVKKLLSQYLTADMQIEFEREIMLMKDLHHPNIVQFIGASNIKNSLAIVIEFAPLGSLASVMEKHSLSLNTKITMLLESAKALQFLHANGIIHRDIKPQNILVFSMEPKSPVHVKLTDFGTARMISEEAMTVTKNIGTISFMSPESLGKNPRIEKSADVYSFALLMWSVLMEQTPFLEFKWDSDVEAHVKKRKSITVPK
jgi:hypothetical protein